MAVNKTAVHTIPPSKSGIIQRAVVNACDARDGVKDGVLDNPTSCTFDPKELACRAGDDPQACLTPPQVDVARAFYEPVTDPATGALVTPGLERGTEASWATLGGPVPIINSVEAFKYAVFQDPAWDWRTFNLSRDLRKGGRRRQRRAGSGGHQPEAVRRPRRQAAHLSRLERSADCPSQHREFLSGGRRAPGQRTRGALHPALHGAWHELLPGGDPGPTSSTRWRRSNSGSRRVGRRRRFPHRT